MTLPTAKFVAGGTIATAADLRQLKDVIVGESIPRLAAAISATDTSLTVGTGEGTRLPDANFTVRLLAETIFVTTRTGDVCSSLVRGVDGTTAVTHAIGESVNAFISAAHHNQLAAEIIAMQKSLHDIFAPTSVGPNLLANPSFDAGSTGWTLENAIRVSTPATHSSPWVQTNQGVRDAGLKMSIAGDRPAVTPGSTIVMALDVWVNDASQLLLIGFEEYSAGMEWLRSTYPIAINVSASSLGLVPVTWKRLSEQVTIGSDTAFLSMNILGNRSPGASSYQAGFDDIFIGEETPIPPASS